MINYLFKKKCLKYKNYDTKFFIKYFCLVKALVIKMRVFNLLKNRIDEMEDKEDIDGLIDALNDNDENMRKEALMALERIGDHRATEHIMQSLKDPDRTIQEEAITALGRIVVDPFIHDLKGEDRNLKDKAIIALNHIRELNVIEKNILPNEIKSSTQDNNQLDQDLKEEIPNLNHDEQIIEKLVPTEISDMDAKRAELIKKGLSCIH